MFKKLKNILLKLEKLIYRELPNRQGHSNEKPSYFAFGFGTLSSYFKECNKEKIEQYKKIHYNCCGVNNEESKIKKEKKEDRKIRKKEFKKSQRSSRKSSM